MSWLSQLFHPGRGYQDAMDANTRGYNEGQGIRQPYMNNGTNAGNTLMEQLNKLMNPGGLQDEWNKNYETSNAAKQDIQQANQSGMDAASSQGLMGSSASINNIQNQSANIMQHDRQQYMKDMMEKYMAGIGLGKDVYGTGAGMANSSAGAADQYGQNQAGLSFGKYNAGPNMITGGLSKLMEFIENMNNPGRNNGRGGY